MSSTIRVSVLIPCHSLTYLEKSIQSIAAQSMPANEFEVILVADRIKRKDVEIFLKSSILNYQIYESNKPGIVNALNLGLAKSKSIYVARMDEDDLMEPNRLTQQCSFLDLNPECIVVGGQLKLINENGEIFGVSRFQNKVVRRVDLLRRSPIAHPAAMFRREMVLNIGGYRENLPEDWDLWVRLSQQGGIANLSSYVLRYRIHDNQLSRSKMYKHATSRLMIGTSLYARENGLLDSPTEVIGINGWSAETGKALSEVSGEYQRFVCDVRRETEMNMILNKGISLNNIFKLIRTVIYKPQLLFEYILRVFKNRYHYWKSL